MAEFDVHGPFELKKTKAKNGFRLHFDDFWNQSKKVEVLAEERGIYIFAAKVGRGYTPLYVGKATKSFEQECFNISNKYKYVDAMVDYLRCTPVMLFVVHPKQRGKLNSKQIDQIETFLIQAAYEKNKEIQNIKKTETPTWSIRGVVRN